MHFQRQQGADHAQQARRHPELARKAVGGVPVFFAGQGPLDPDAHGAVLADFGHIVAHHQKQQPESKTGDEICDSDSRRPLLYRHPDSGHQQRDNRHQPKDQPHRFFALALPVAVVCKHQHQTNPVDRQQPDTGPENLPAQRSGQQNHQGRKQQFDFVFSHRLFHHRTLLSNP